MIVLTLLWPENSQYSEERLSVQCFITNNALHGAAEEYRPGSPSGATTDLSMMSESIFYFLLRQSTRQ